MIWRIIKMVLKAAYVEVRLTEGDILHVHVKLGGNTVIDRRIDFIPGA